MSCTDKDGGSITLPEQNVFRNLKNAKRFAIDIGMIVFFNLLYFIFCNLKN